MSIRRITALAAVCGLLGLAVLALGLAGGPGPRADATPAELTAQPVLGIGARSVQPFGVAADGAAWAWGSAVGALPVGADGAALPVGDDGFVLLRGQGGTWRPVQGALAADGTALDRFVPAGGSGPGAGRVTPGGGVAVAGFSGTRFALLTGAAGGAVREVPSPDTATTTVLSREATPVRCSGRDDRRGAGRHGIGVAGGGDRGRLARPARDAAGRPDAARCSPARAPRAPRASRSPRSTSRGGTGVFLGVVASSLEPAVLHWNGAAWSREPVDLPAGSSGCVPHPGARRDVGRPGVDARAAGRRASAAGSCCSRVTRRAPRRGGSSGRSARRRSPTARRPSVGLTGVQAVRYPAQGITASSSGVWLDGTWRQGTRTGSVTVHYDIAAGRVTGTWCDALKPDGSPLCTGPLGSDLSAPGGRGHRSYAWSGLGLRDARHHRRDPPRRRLARHPRDVAAVRRHGVRPPAGRRRVDGRADGRGVRLRRRGLARRRRRPRARHRNSRRGLARRACRWRSAGRCWRSSASPGRRRGTRRRARSPSAPTAPSPATRPVEGWRPEFLLASSGKRATPTLRGVAWPEPGVAYAVGDNGEMWEWRSTTGLWQRDGGRPVDLDAQLTGVAFRPGDPYDGYAVGRGGTLLRAGLGWEPEALPQAVAGADLLAVAYAGRDALVVARRQVFEGGGVSRSSALLVNNGSGWKVDEGAQRLLDAAGPSTSLTTVVGLPDGGAVAAGVGIVLVRDGAGAPVAPDARPDRRAAGGRRGGRPRGRPGPRRPLGLADHDLPRRRCLRVSCRRRRTCRFRCCGRSRCPRRAP